MMSISTVLVVVRRARIARIAAWLLDFYTQIMCDSVLKLVCNFDVKKIISYNYYMANQV